MSFYDRFTLLRHHITASLAVFFLCLSASAAYAAQTGEVIRPKVVVVGYFELGADTGDKPGEYQYWVEREHLDRVIPVPGAFHPVRTNADGSIVAVLAGRGNIHPAVTLMALGLDPHFDLRKSYWLFDGIAGIAPQAGSLGSAVWTDYVVNGDLAREIDAREMPKDWPTGYVPLDKTRPYEEPRVKAGSPEDVRTWTDGRAHSNRFGDVIQLNPGLMEWAYQLTKDHPLADSADLKAERAAYVGYPNAQRPPFVLKGSNLATETFWHGHLLEERARGWIRYSTDGCGHYVTTAMNDSGSLVALFALTQAGRADVNRALLLRTASNFDMPPPGMSAAESMNREQHGALSAYLPSLEADYEVGSRVVHALIAGWSRYQNQLPQATR
ncbi:MAG: purine nucleoside permease [Acidobacteriaceae bacterium]